MSLRFLSCGAGNVHLVGPCYNCYISQGGLMIGTTAKTHKGRLIAKCLDCGKTVDYYVDAQAEKIWKLEPIESKGASPIRNY